MIHPRDIHTLTEFKRDSTRLIRKLDASGRPAVLTVDGRARVVVLGVEAYERIADLAGEAEAIEKIRRGLDDVEAGRTMSLEEFGTRLRKRLRSGSKR